MSAKKKKTENKSKRVVNSKINRIQEISERLGKLSFKLLKEGNDDNNDEIIKLGAIIYLLSISIENKKDMEDLHNLTTMFSAKKVLENHPEVFLNLGFNGDDEK